MKQTFDVKLAGSLSIITKNLDEIKQSTQEIGKVIEKSQHENNTPQLAIEKTSTNQPIENTPTNQPIENTPTNQPIENDDGVIYDVELENTLNRMKDNTGFFETHHDPQRGWLLNNCPNKMLRGTKVKINETKYNITPGLQKVFTNHSYETAKSMNDIEKLVSGDFLQKTV